MSYKTDDEKIAAIIGMFRDDARQHEVAAKLSKSVRMRHFHKVSARTMRDAAACVQANFPNVVAS